MELQNKGNYVGKVDNYEKPVKLEDALTISGFGRYNLLAIAGGGVSLLGGLGILLGLSYTLPATDCDMPLSPTEKGFVASAAFTGILFSSHLYGYLSDTYGRRKIVILSNYACSLVTFLASFSPNAYVLSAMSFTNGFLASGLLTPAYVFISEFCAMEKRATALLIGSAIAALATSILPGLAWIIIPLKFRISLFFGLELTPWRVYIALLSLPMLVCNVIMHFLYESPKFLISKGRTEETLQVLKTIYSINYSTPKKNYPITNVQVDDSDVVPDAKKVNIFKDIWRQTVTLFSPPLLSYMVVSCALNLGLIGSYNVTMLWLPELISRMSLYDDDHDSYDLGICEVFNYKEEVVLNKTEANLNYDVITECQTTVNESVYIATMIIGIAQFVFFGVMSILSERYSRRGLIVSCLLVGAVSYLSTPFMTSMMLTITTFGVVVVFVGAALPLAMSIIVDFFPTYLRGMATCICMIFGRTGASFGGQLFGILQQNYCQYSYYGLSIILLSISALCFIIPLNRKS